MTTKRAKRAHADDVQDAYLDEMAGRIARRALEGADLTLGWKDAGYRSALDAARAMVGDGGDPDINDRAARLIAATIRTPLVVRPTREDM